MTDVEWYRLPAPALKALAATGEAVAILPLASIEQHGPHLPTMTDTRLGHEVACRAARRAKTPSVVAPVMWAGLSEHHMAFGGTLSIGHEAFRAVVTDLIHCVVRHGFTRVLLANSHGGNRIAMADVADAVATEVGAAVVAGGFALEAAPAFAEILEDQPGMMHACEAETSMMLALEPDLVDASNLAGVAGPAGGPGALTAGRAAYRWRPFQHVTGTGVRGNPARASAEKGERLLEASADALAALIDDPETWAPIQDLRP